MDEGKILPNASLLNFSLLHGHPAIINKLIAMNIKPDENTLNCALLGGHPTFIAKILKMNSAPNADTLNCAILGNSAHILKNNFNIRTTSNKSDKDILSELKNKYFLPIMEQIRSVSTVKPFQSYS